MKLSETKWDQVELGGTKRIRAKQVKPSQSKSNQVRLRITEGVQVNPSETEWDQVKLRETKRIHVEQAKPNETKWN